MVANTSPPITQFTPLHKRFREITIALYEINKTLNEMHPVPGTGTQQIIVIVVNILLWLRSLLKDNTRDASFNRWISKFDQTPSCRQLLSVLSSLPKELQDDLNSILQPLKSRDDKEKRVQAIDRLYSHLIFAWAQLSDVQSPAEWQRILSATETIASPPVEAETDLSMPLVVQTEDLQSVVYSNQPTPEAFACISPLAQIESLITDENFNLQAVENFLESSRQNLPKLMALIAEVPQLQNSLRQAFHPLESNQFAVRVQRFIEIQELRQQILAYFSSTYNVTSD